MVPRDSGGTVDPKEELQKFGDVGDLTGVNFPPVEIDGKMYTREEALEYFRQRRAAQAKQEGKP